MKRWFGLDKTKSRLENDIQEVGFKYGMNNVTATIGLVQMRYLEEVLGRFISNGKYYDEHLKNIQELNWLSILKIQKLLTGCTR